MANGKEGALLIHPVIADDHPQFMSAVDKGIGKAFPRVDIEIGKWSDHTKQLRLSSSHYGKRVVVPAVLSGRSLETNLMALTETGYALTAHNTHVPPQDRTEFIVGGSDFELRGDKKTVSQTDKPIEKTELLNAHFNMDMLIRMGGMTEFYGIDPHNEEFLLKKAQEYGISVTAFTGLAEGVRFLKSRKMITPDVMIMPPDEGAIWRNMIVSWLAGEKEKPVPIGACIEKGRKDGKAYMKGIIGRENVKGKTILTADDMGASYSTIEILAGQCADAGAEGLIVLLTHAKDVDAAPDNLARIMSKLPFRNKTLVVTNTTPYVRRLQEKNIPGVNVIDVSPMFVRATRHMLAPSNPRYAHEVKDDMFELATREKANYWLHQTSPQLHEQLNGNRGNK